MLAGRSFDLAYIVLPEGTRQEVHWTTSDPTVATISHEVEGACRINAHREGTAVITVQTASSGSVSTCDVEVHEEHPYGIYPEKSVIWMREGQKGIYINMHWKPDDAHKPSGNPTYVTIEGYAKVAPDGLVSGFYIGGGYDRSVVEVTWGGLTTTVEIHITSKGDQNVIAQSIKSRGERAMRDNYYFLWSADVVPANARDTRVTYRVASGIENLVEPIPVDTRDTFYFAPVVDHSKPVVVMATLVDNPAAGEFHHITFV